MAIPGRWPGETARLSAAPGPPAGMVGPVSATTVYGVVVLVFMMAMYAVEGRHRRYIAGFAVGCALSSSYGFLSGAWPFGVVEAIWCLVALRRYAAAGSTAPGPVT